MGTKFLTCLLLAAVLAACGSSDSGRHDPKTHRDGHTRTASVPWELQRTHGNAVKIAWTGGACLTPDRIRVLQTRSYVTVTVLAHLYLPGAGEACPLYAIAYLKVVRLLEPLGHRKLLHGAITSTVLTGAPAAG